jgi:hypothetical protein
MTSNTSWVVEWLDDEGHVLATKAFPTIPVMAQWFGYSVSSMRDYIKGRRELAWSKNQRMANVRYRKVVYPPAPRRKRGQLCGPCKALFAKPS